MKFNIFRGNDTTGKYKSRVILNAVKNLRRWIYVGSHVGAEILRITLRVAQNDKFLGFAFYRYMMRDVTARQGRAPALQGYLYTHSCEIFRLCET